MLKATIYCANDPGVGLYPEYFTMELPDFVASWVDTDQELFDYMDELKERIKKLYIALTEHSVKVSFDIETKWALQKELWGLARSSLIVDEKNEKLNLLHLGTKSFFETNNSYNVRIGAYLADQLYPIYNDNAGIFLYTYGQAASFVMGELFGKSQSIKHETETFSTFE